MKPLSIQDAIRMWERIAIKVMMGEYDQADSSTKASVVIGLKGLKQTETVREAIKRISPKDEPKKGDGPTTEKADIQTALKGIR